MGKDTLTIAIFSLLVIISFVFGLIVSWEYYFLKHESDLETNPPFYSQISAVKYNVMENCKIFQQTHPNDSIHYKDDSNNTERKSLVMGCVRNSTGTYIPESIITMWRHADWNKTQTKTYGS